MSYINDMLTEQATYWEPTGEDEFGNTTFSEPQTIDVRWEDKSELFKDEQGNEVVSNAVIYTLEDLQLEGYLYKGVTSESSTNVNAREIRQLKETPNVEANQNLHKVWL